MVSLAMTSILISNLIPDLAPEIHAEITGLSLDSRTVKSGDLFFAYSGTHLDGKKFIDDAIQKGARAVLVESDDQAIVNKDGVPIIPVPHLKQKVSELASRFYFHPAKKIKMIGITGTNGKTSCSHFIAAALQQLNIPCGIIGTLGSGFYGKINPGSLTTPDPITLHSIFAEFVAQGAKMVAMEVSSHSIDQGRVQGIEFEVGVFTNLTRDHLDYHGTMEAYGATKRKLFDTPLTKKAVINADDTFGHQLLNSLNRKALTGYSQVSSELFKPIVTATQIQLYDSGIQAYITSPWGGGKLKTSLIGQFNLSNVLAALTTLCLLDVPFNDALHSLSHLTPVSGRMQALGGGDKPLVIVDYAHTPDALEKVLNALKSHCNGKLYCLFGCGGDRDRGKRPLMAAVAQRFADVICVTDDNPRTEDAKQIVADIMQGFSSKNLIQVEHDRAKAIQTLIQQAKPEDCVLIAGKGAELYQQVGNEKIPFSDVEEVLRALKE